MNALLPRAWHPPFWYPINTSQLRPCEPFLTPAPGVELFQKCPHQQALCRCPQIKLEQCSILKTVICPHTTAGSKFDLTISGQPHNQGLRHQQIKSQTAFVSFKLIYSCWVWNFILNNSDHHFGMVYMSRGRENPIKTERDTVYYSLKKEGSHYYHPSNNVSYVVIDW
jgi:hypothetical protein